ncbi:hypothetical protein DFJ73DRAFT_955999 [Zopfochytrium polystomum]|nr:hypothetical protein DFJ73DRAFT_955999 [Zopfochytrium polystomum]
MRCRLVSNGQSAPSLVLAVGGTIVPPGSYCRSSSTSSTSNALIARSCRSARGPSCCHLTTAIVGLAPLSKTNKVAAGCVRALSSSSPSLAPPSSPKNRDVPKSKNSVASPKSPVSRLRDLLGHEYVSKRAIMACLDEINAPDAAQHRAALTPTHLRRAVQLLFFSPHVAPVEIGSADHETVASLMRCKGMDPRFIEYNLLVGVVDRLDAHRSMAFLRAMELDDGVVPDVTTYEALARALALRGDGPGAAQIMRAMAARGVHVSDRMRHAVLLGYSRAARPWPGLAHLREWMASRTAAKTTAGGPVHLPPSRVLLYSVVMAGMARAGLKQAVRELRAELDSLMAMSRPVRSEADGGRDGDDVFRSNVAVITRNIEMRAALARERSWPSDETDRNVQSAFKLLQRMAESKREYPRADTFNTLIAGTFINEDPRKGLDSFAAMTKQFGVSPDVITFNTLIYFTGRRGMLLNAMQLYSRLVESGHQPNLRTYSVLINVFVRNEDLEAAVECYKDLLLAGLAPTRYIYYTLMIGFARAGDRLNGMKYYQALKLSRIPITPFANVILTVLDFQTGDVRSAMERLRSELLNATSRGKAPPRPSANERANMGQLFGNNSPAAEDSRDDPLQIGFPFSQMHSIILSKLASIAAPPLSATEEQSERTGSGLAENVFSGDSDAMFSFNSPLPASSPQLVAVDAALDFLEYARNVSGVWFFPGSTYDELASSIKKLGDVERLERLVQLAISQSPERADPEDIQSSREGADWEDRVPKTSTLGKVPPPYWTRVIGVLKAGVIEVLSMRTKKWTLTRTQGNAPLEQGLRTAFERAWPILRELRPQRRPDDSDEPAGGAPPSAAEEGRFPVPMSLMTSSYNRVLHMVARFPQAFLAVLEEMGARGIKQDDVTFRAILSFAQRQKSADLVWKSWLRFVEWAESQHAGSDGGGGTSKATGGEDEDAQTAASPAAAAPSSHAGIPPVPHGLVADLSDPKTPASTAVRYERVLRQAFLFFVRQRNLARAEHVLQSAERRFNLRLLDRPPKWVVKALGDVEGEVAARGWVVRELLDGDEGTAAVDEREEGADGGGREAGGRAGWSSMMDTLEGLD